MIIRFPLGFCASFTPKVTAPQLRFRRVSTHVGGIEFWLWRGGPAIRFWRLSQVDRRNPSAVVQHVERVPMVRGRYDPTASTATGYAWFVWDRRERSGATQFAWIPPARSRLFRSADSVAAE